MTHHILTDNQWEAVAPLLPGKVGDRGRSGVDNRRSLVAHRLPALPPLVHRRRLRPHLRGHRRRPRHPLRADRRLLRQGPPARHRCPKKGRLPDDSRRQQAIGRSRAGLTSKLMALVDRRGRLVRSTVIGGDAAESRELGTLLGGVPTSELVADKTRGERDGRVVGAVGHRFVLLGSRSSAHLADRTAGRVMAWYRNNHAQEATGAQARASTTRRPWLVSCALGAFMIEIVPPRNAQRRTAGRRRRSRRR